jgi:hypothetical protein
MIADVHGASIAVFAAGHANIDHCTLREDSVPNLLGRPLQPSSHREVSYAADSRLSAIRELHIQID